PGDAEVRALPLELFGLRIGIREPEADGIVMGDGEAVAFRCERQALGRRRRLEVAQAALAVARGDTLAGTPGEGAVAAGDDRVDPAALLVADLLHRAIAGDGDDAAV